MESSLLRGASLHGSQRRPRRPRAQSARGSKLASVTALLLPCKRVTWTSAASGAVGHWLNSAASSPPPRVLRARERRHARRLARSRPHERHADHPDEIVVRSRSRSRLPTDRHRRCTDDCVLEFIVRGTRRLIPRGRGTVPWWAPWLAVRSST